jgi:2-oxo-3-hexenedioate decarboxylase
MLLEMTEPAAAPAPLLDPATLAAHAVRLDEAWRERRETAPLEKTYGAFALESAYAVQAAGMALRLGRGERVSGYKMGFTSEAKRRQMGLGAPICGVLTQETCIGDGGHLEVASGLHPKAEPEIFFITARELGGSLSLAEAADAVAQVGAALEVLDSRYAGFKYFSLPDVIADNCSSWRYVLSARTRGLHGLAIDQLRMQLFVDGVLSAEAPSSAISGNPLASLVQLAGLLAQTGRSIPAGSVVLSGAATAAVPLVPGMTVRLEVEGLFPVTLRAV